MDGDAVGTTCGCTNGLHSSLRDLHTPPTPRRKGLKPAAVEVKDGRSRALTVMRGWLGVTGAVSSSRQAARVDIVVGSR